MNNQDGRNKGTRNVDQVLGTCHKNIMEGTSTIRSMRYKSRGNIKISAIEGLGQENI